MDEFTEHRKQADRRMAARIKTGKVIGAANEASPKDIGAPWPDELSNGDKRAPRQALQFYLSESCTDEGFPLTLTIFDTDRNFAVYTHSQWINADIAGRTKLLLLAVGLVAFLGGLILGRRFPMESIPTSATNIPTCEYGLIRPN